MSNNKNLFITIPETTLPNGTVVPAFQVGQYLASQDEDGKAAVTAEGKPWVRINYADAWTACAAAGLRLITELQWLAIAHDIAQQPINWTGGEVGKGRLFQGLRNWSVEEAQPGTYEPEDTDERRWHQLSTGERIYDMAGNALSWVFDNVQGDELGVVAKAFAEDSPSLSTAPFPSRKNGMGWRPDAEDDWSGDALIRGGYWVSESYAGVFRLDYDWPESAYDYVGFRCTK